MEAILSIQLVPTGQVVGVSVVKSSGNDAFDLSVQQAVKKVGRFEKLQELSRQSPVIFEQNFRQFRLVFRPEDLRL
jgi:colicin import membrane protein